MYSTRFVILALESIAHGSHADLLPADLTSWPSKTKSEAESLLTSVTEFDFLAQFTILHTLLSGLSGLTQQLQGTSMEVCKAYTQVRHVSTMVSVIVTVTMPHVITLHPIIYHIVNLGPRQFFLFEFS